MSRFLTGNLVLGCLVVSLAAPPVARADGPDNRPAFLRGDPVDATLARDEVGKILVAQRQSARTELNVRYEALAIPGGGRNEREFTAIQDCSQRLLGKELELRATAAERVRLLGQYLEYQKAVEQIAKEHFEAGAIRKQDYERCRFLRLEAELQLLKAKREKK